MFSFFKKRKKKKNEEEMIEETVVEAEESEEDEAQDLADEAESESPSDESGEDSPDEASGEPVSELEPVILTEEADSEGSAEISLDDEVLEDSTEEEERAEDNSDDSEQVASEDISDEVSEELSNEASPDLETEEAEEATEEPEKKRGGFKSLFAGLNKTRKKIGDQLDNLLNNYDEIDEDLYEEIEDILITADIGMKCTMELIDLLKEELVQRKVKDASKVKGVLRDVMADYLKLDGQMELVTKSPTVILVIGVNGAGKTTSIGKISHRLKSEGKKVVLAAADTFRAAAIDQLKVWAERADVSFVAHSEGSDPSAVIFDGIKSAQAKNADVLICDTAGRLHNKVNLMNELNKMFRIIEREYPEANKEVLLVLDATTGQNAVNQAKEFLQTAGITGLVVTKLDGTAKGGFIFAIKSELGIPVKLIGVGEKIEDLQTFDPETYASAILNL